MSSFPVIDSFAKRISARRAAINAEIAPMIRNHFVQLFRRAHAVEPKLTGMDTGMGVATANGSYDVTDDGETWALRAHDWSPTQCAKSPHPEVEAFLAEIDAYSNRICAGRWDDLPGIETITLADLLPPAKPARKAARRAN